MRSPNVVSSSITSLGLRVERTPHQLLRGVKLPPEHGEHVHAGMRLAFQQHDDVVAVHFDADSFFERHGVGLVRRLVQHGGEAEKLARRRFVHHHFLMVLIHGGDPHPPGDHDVSPPPASPIL